MAISSAVCQCVRTAGVTGSGNMRPDFIMVRTQNIICFTSRPLSLYYIQSSQPPEGEEGGGITKETTFQYMYF